MLGLDPRRNDHGDVPFRGARRIFTPGEHFQGELVPERSTSCVSAATPGLTWSQR